MSLHTSTSAAVSSYLQFRHVRLEIVSQLGTYCRFRGPQVVGQQVKVRPGKYVQEMLVGLAGLPGRKGRGEKDVIQVCPALDPGFARQRASTLPITYDEKRAAHGVGAVTRSSHLNVRTP